MKRLRRNHAAIFKAKVAIAAFRGDKTLAELAQQCDVHPNQIVQWKTQLQERATDLFATAAERKAGNGPNVKDLHAKIGQLAMENDFLASALGRIDDASAIDITYIPMRRGFVYLTAVLDWATRRVLAWRLSNSMTVDFCLDAVEAAIRDYGVPEILNTDQGSQFTGTAFVDQVQQHGVQISMDGKGSWRDNVFVERLWKSVKYEEVYLHAYDSVAEARQGLQRYFSFYNQRRPHNGRPAVSNRLIVALHYLKDTYKGSSVTKKLRDSSAGSDIR